MQNEIYPCLWLDGKAKEAAEFYCSVFSNTEKKEENPLVVTIESHDQRFMLLNGGPMFTINPSISFFVVCETEEETNQTWEKLLEGGSALMPFDQYEWSKKYGWVQDKYGVNWQLSYGKMEEVGRKFSPSFLFCGQQNGRAEEAIRFYTSVFQPSSITGILKYAANDNETVGNVKHAQFRLGKHVFMAMDSAYPHAFGFNEGVSLVVECETQSEIDFYWEKLSAVPEAEQCGWLKDQFGISWQIVPSVLKTLMSDPTRSERVINAFMQMKKFDIEKLKNA